MRKGPGDKLILGSGVTYLLDAPFTGDDQGYTNGQILNTAAEGVTTGYATVVEGDGTLAISSNKLAFTAQTTPDYADQGLFSLAITRALGRIGCVTVNLDATDRAVLPLAWSTVEGIGCGFSGGGANGVIAFTTSAEIRFYYTDGSGTYIDNLGAYAGSTDYQLALVLGGYDSNGVPYRTGEAAADYKYGEALFIKGGAFTNWALLWRDTRNNTATLYAIFSNYNATGTLDDLKVTDTTYPDLLTPGTYSATPNASDTFTHQADFYLEFDVDTVPNGDEIIVKFRIQDATNYWQVTVDSSGNLDLDEIASGSPTQRGTDAGNVGNGDRITIIADDDTIYVFEAGNKRITYTSATNFKTETDGEVDALGTGGAVANLSVFERSGGSYDTILNEV